MLTGGQSSQQMNKGEIHLPKDLTLPPKGQSTSVLALCTQQCRFPGRCVPGSPWLCRPLPTPVPAAQSCACRAFGCDVRLFPNIFCPRLKSENKLCKPHKSVSIACVISDAATSQH